MSLVEATYTERFQAIPFNAINLELKDWMRGEPDHHGYKHSVDVSIYARALALKLDYNPDIAELAGLLHDLRWRDEEARTERGIKFTGDFKKVKLDFAKQILDGLKDEGSLSDNNVVEILDAIDRHSMLPENDTGEPSTLVSILRDADRLSRFGVEGTFDILETDYDARQRDTGKPVPFYDPYSPYSLNETSEQTKERHKEKGLMPRKDIVSGITDIQFCQEWVAIMETPPGIELAEQLSKVNASFLAFVSTQKRVQWAQDAVATAPDGKAARLEHYSYKQYMVWLKQIFESTSDRKAEAEALLHSGDVDSWANIMVNEVNNPALLTEQGFKAVDLSRDHIKKGPEKKGGRLRENIIHAREIYNANKKNKSDLMETRK